MGIVRDAVEIYFLILILAVVQSLFGVGILLFGTPIMLIMGHSYEQSLLYLLPASAALSWSQVKDFRDISLNGNYRRLFILVCIPMLFTGMFLASELDLRWEVKLFVTIMLIVAFAIRTSFSFRSVLQDFMNKNLPVALALMGIIHGLSNMGGSILSPMVSSLYTDKTKVLAGVSFDYAFMATIQLFILIILQGHSIHFNHLIGAAISLSVRHLIGKRIFAFTTESGYRRLIDGLIIGNALMLGIQL